MLHLYNLFQDLRISATKTKADQSQLRSYGNESHLKVLEQKIDSLYLMNLASLELLTELGVTKEQIQEKIQEIDLRDGKEDGKLAPSNDCSDCGRRISKRRTNCFYCGAKVNTLSV